VIRRDAAELRQLERLPRHVDGDEEGDRQGRVLEDARDRHPHRHRGRDVEDRVGERVGIADAVGRAAHPPRDDAVDDVGEEARQQHGGEERAGKPETGQHEDRRRAGGAKRDQDLGGGQYHVQ